MKKLVIDESLTQQVANLARLELTSAEVSTFTQQLGDIVSYIDQLQSVDVKGVLPLTHPLVDHASGSLRDDEVVFTRDDVVIDFPKDNQGRPKTLLAAPDSVFEDGGGSFKVPQVI
jgi:aspartyl-tRNA(Asn)/glutamyl-tRNA(Gln) amidotransferase subunit C